MIEEIVIITLGGIVLWRRNYGKLHGNPVNDFIENVVIEDKMRVDNMFHVIGDYRLAYILNNEFSLMIIAVSQRRLHLLFLSDLVQDVQSAFVECFSSDLKHRLYLRNPTFVEGKFEASFDACFATFQQHEKQKSCASTLADVRLHDDSMPSPIKQSDKLLAGKNEDKKEQHAANLEKLPPKSGATILKRGMGRKSERAVVASPQNTKPKEKVSRRWNGDASDHVDASQFHTESDISSQREELQKRVTEEQQKVEAMNANPNSWSDEDEDDKTLQESNLPKNNNGLKPSKQTSRNRIQTWLRNRFGDREIDEHDIEIFLPTLREKLINKNVAVDIADQIISSVSVSLKGVRIGTFEVMNTFILDALEKALHRILTPHKEIQILREIARCRDESVPSRPYVICFCGVNGVGKSTSLSKVAFWCKQNGYSVMIAACDTFRGGAVEQLQVHATRLNVQLFAQGYGQDASAVAANAINKAKKEKIDVVLIDTAGRMQGHETRMIALAKLVHENKPDVTLFVGEALVGNDGADQLRTFNECFRRLTPVGRPPRGIDGIFLTKFDTIDDKVGTAISMAYQCGQPILFVGVGQTYQDIKHLNPQVVVRALLS